MAKANQDPARRVTFQVSTKQRAAFKEPLVAYVFNRRGELTERVEVKGDKVELSLPEGDPGRTRVFIAPRDEKLDAAKPTPATLERLGAYEPVLQAGGGKLVDRFEIPGPILDHWPFCSCWVRGRVLRRSDNRAVCDARVHICEVDRFLWWILKLPDADVLRLRDDLLEVIRRPPIPRPRPFPDPDPGPLRPFPGPGPDPAPLTESLLRFRQESRRAAAKGRLDPGARVGFNPQPDPPLERVGLNPQPLPPRSRVSLNPQPEPPGVMTAMSAPIQLTPEATAALRSTSTVMVRNALAENYKLILPWFCIWPWWWWRFRCDEVAVLTTDAHGRFETTIYYPCGDQPDLYFWVEYDFGSGFETVYHPAIACNTYWNYLCGSEVIIRVTDPRVPGCEDEPDLPGCQVVVLSIGNGVAVRQVQTASTPEGLTTAGHPFGGTLEPRLDFSRTELIDVKGIPYYRWSYRRLTAPDGGGGAVDPGSVPLNVWTILTHDVYRHYKLGTSYPSDLMGPMPTSGPNAAPVPNLFRIRPAAPPAGPEWIVLNEHVDLATGYFETASLTGAPPSSGPYPLPDDLAAGRYELKLELFNSAGALVDWTAAGVDLRITDQDAPFSSGTITTSPAPDYNRILAGGHTMGFRMVVRVDNNRCYAQINPLGGTVTPDPDCGFHYYDSLATDVAGMSFVARHPNRFATYGFSTVRGAGDAIAEAGTSGTSGEAGSNGFMLVGAFTYSKNVNVSDLLEDCPNAAFSELLVMTAMATNGYSAISAYNHLDHAAFALAQPCPPCECEEEEEDE